MMTALLVVAISTVGQQGDRTDRRTTAVSTEGGSEWRKRIELTRLLSDSGALDKLVIIYRPSYRQTLFAFGIGKVVLQTYPPNFFAQDTALLPTCSANKSQSEIRDIIRTMILAHFFDLPEKSFVYTGDQNNEIEFEKDVKLHSIVVDDGANRSYRDFAEGKYRGMNEQIPAAFDDVENALRRLAGADLDGAPCPMGHYREWRRTGRGEVHQFEGGPPDYRISLTKQFRSGYFQRRAQSLLDTVPVSEGIRLDTFRTCDISVGPGEDIGIVSETVYGAKILDWFIERGILPMTEGPVDAYYGKLEGVQHRFVISDPFQLMMMQGKLYGGGKNQEGVGQALGWSMNLGYAFRETNALGGAHFDKYSEANIADMYYLGNLTQSYLLKKNLIWLGTEKVGEKQVEKDGKTVTVPRNNYIARFSDGAVSTVLDDGSWTVVDHDFKSVDGQRRVIPIGDNEIVLYSVDGGAVDWTLPSQWARAMISATPIDSSVATAARYIVGSDSKVEISTKGRTAYILKRLN